MKKITFLITDDHPLFRMGLKNLLSVEYNGGLNIFEASNGKQALEILDKNIVDCLLNDWDRNR